MLPPRGEERVSPVSARTSALSKGPAQADGAADNGAGPRVGSAYDNAAFDGGRAPAGALPVAYATAV